jgi:hypothetical protein
LDVREDIRRQIASILDGITAMYYNEDRNELFTGTKEGNLILWSCFGHSMGENDLPKSNQTNLLIS